MWLQWEKLKEIKLFKYLADGSSTEQIISRIYMSKAALGKAIRILFELRERFAKVIFIDCSVISAKDMDNKKEEMYLGSF